MQVTMVRVVVLLGYRVAAQTDVVGPKEARAVESICIASAPAEVPSRWCITPMPPLDMRHAIGVTQTGRHHRW